MYYKMVHLLLGLIGRLNILYKVGDEFEIDDGKKVKVTNVNTIDQPDGTVITIVDSEPV